MLHPSILVLGLLVLTGVLARGTWSATILAAGLLLVLYLWRRPHTGVFPRLRRLRWFFLSIVVLYAWFFPGEPLWPDLGAFSPVREGLLHGGLRCLSLAVVVVAVHWVLDQAPRPGLIDAIARLLRPLSWLGLPADRLSVRLVLTLQALDSVQEQVRSAIPREGRSFSVAAISDRAARLLHDVLERADRQPAVEIEVPTLGAPSLWQWLGLGGFSVLLLTGLWWP